jgi:hypothetical protein
MLLRNIVEGNKKMRKILITGILIFLVSIISFPRYNLAESAKADQYFASYGAISWEDEKTYLDSFAVALSQNPETVGYIGFYLSEKDSYKKIKARIDQAKLYLINYRRIEKKRIVIVYLGKGRNNTMTILQPIDKDSPVPFK